MNLFFNFLSIWIFLGNAFCFGADTPLSQSCQKVQIVYFGDSFSTDFFLHKQLPSTLRMTPKWAGSAVVSTPPWLIHIRTIPDFISHRYFANFGARYFLDGMKTVLREKFPNIKFFTRSFAVPMERMTGREGRPLFIPMLEKWLKSRSPKQDPCTVTAVWLGHNDLDWLHESGENYETKIQLRSVKYEEEWRRAFRTFQNHSYKGKVVIFTQANHEQRTVGYLEAVELHSKDASKFNAIEASQKIIPEGALEDLRPYTLKLAQWMDQSLKCLGELYSTDELGYFIHISSELSEVNYSSSEILSPDAVHFKSNFLFPLGRRAALGINKVL